MSEDLDLMNDILDEDVTENKGLPPFLNVLTILTFVGSGLGLLGSLWNFINLESSRRQIEQSRALMESFGGDSPLGGLMESAIAAIDNGPVLYGTQMLVAIGCIIGAILMRKLNKSGYYLYVAASVASIVVPLVVLGFGLAGWWVLLGAVFTIAFVVMYSVNLKDLR